VHAETFIIVPVLLLFAALVAAIIGVIFVLAIRILKGSSGGRKNRMNAEESQMIQDIYHGLTRMEERIEALETLLLDREHRKEGDRS